MFFGRMERKQWNEIDYREVSKGKKMIQHKAAIKSPFLISLQTL